MKREILRYSACVLVFAASITVLFLLTPPGREILRIRRHMRELREAPDVREVALSCLSLLHSTSEQTLIAATSRDDRIPAAIRSKRPRSVLIAPSSQSVTVEFGGGFFHYGYRFEAVSSAPGRWHLLLYGETENDRCELIRL